MDVKRGIICDKVTSHFDIMPTILDEAGIDIPDTVEGLSLAPYTRGENVKWRDFSEHSRSNETWQFVTDGKEKFIWESISNQKWFF